MTRKDYIALAQIFARHADEPYGDDAAAVAAKAGYELARQRIARELCGVLAGGNAAFRRSTFLAACKVPE